MSSANGQSAGLCGLCSPTGWSRPRRGAARHWLPRGGWSRWGSREDAAWRRYDRWCARFSIWSAPRGSLLRLTGCAGSAARPDHSRSAARATAAAKAAVAPAPVVELELELPLVGLSSAETVSYATLDGRPTLRSLVKPAAATIYMRSPDGARTAVNPRRDGSFAVAARLAPGQNTFQFTAALLGAVSRSARLAVVWRGRDAARWARAVAADPVKYLPPASAGLNRRLAPIAGLPAVPARPRSVTVS